MRTEGGASQSAPKALFVSPFASAVARMRGSFDAKRVTNICIALCLWGSFDAKRVTNICITLCLWGSFAVSSG